MSDLKYRIFMSVITTLNVIVWSAVVYVAAAIVGYA